MSDINSMHQFKLVSCLQKVFPDEEPRYSPECQKITTLKGETVSFQMAFRGSGFLKEIVRVECISPIADSIRIIRLNRFRKNTGVSWTIFLSCM